MQSAYYGKAGLCATLAVALLGVLVCARPACGQAGFPFTRKAVAPPLDGGTAWLNTPAPIQAQSLRGKFVLLDFWTYCCINCMHILPELEKLEKAYPNSLVVIGVHSAKFANERDTENIRAAILQYGIEHPVINDSEQVLWRRFEVDTWPSLRLIDPEGNWVASSSGELTFEELRDTIKNALPYYRRNKTLVETPLAFDFERRKILDGPLSFPGKVLADATGNRLFVADTSHHRIVVCTLDGRLLETIGSGAAGNADGGYAEAEFDHPQGLALRGDVLYVADTVNHRLRKVDLNTRQVSTIAGTGKQRRRPKQWAEPSRRPIGAAKRVALNSPWALCIEGEWLYVAMAGAHQIWRLSLDEQRLELHAGSGAEDIVDGSQTGRTKVACFAQPSGLASDGQRLFVADSEGSSLRVVGLETDGKVGTLLGTAGLPTNRLFTFGSTDGGPGQALFQHPLDVAYADGRLYVADTYNHLIRAVDVESRVATTLAGSNIDGKGGKGDDPPRFNAPGGLSLAGGKLYVADTNNHAIRVIELGEKQRVSTLTISGLGPPRPPQKKKPSFPGARRPKLETVKLNPQDNAVVFRVEIELPLGVKLREVKPVDYWLEATEEQGPVDRAALRQLVFLDEVGPEIDIRVPVAALEGQDRIELSMSVYYCRDTDGLCRMRNTIWNIPLRLSPDAESHVKTLPLRIDFDD